MKYTYQSVKCKKSSQSWEDFLYFSCTIRLEVSSNSQYNDIRIISSWCLCIRFCRYSELEVVCSCRESLGLVRCIDRMRRCGVVDFCSSHEWLSEGTKCWIMSSYSCRRELIIISKTIGSKRVNKLCCITEILESTICWFCRDRCAIPCIGTNFNIDWPTWIGTWIDDAEVNNSTTSYDHIEWWLNFRFNNQSIYRSCCCSRKCIIPDNRRCKCTTSYDWSSTNVGGSRCWYTSESHSYNERSWESFANIDRHMYIG